VGPSHGASLVVMGASGIFIDHFTADTNVVTFTNSAAGTNQAFIASTMNTNLTPIVYSFPNLIFSATNGIGSTNLTVTNFYVCGTIPALITTNTIDCIISGLAKGKVYGQKVTVGFTNADTVIAP
jgi:hypothetical protein